MPIRTLILAVLTLGLSLGYAAAPPADTGQSRDLACEALRQKLAAVIVPAIEFKDAPLADIVTFLRQQSKALDAAGKGVNIVLNPATATAPVAATPAPAPQTITLSMRKVPLWDLCVYVAILGELRCRLTPEAVQFLPLGVAETTLDSRQFFLAEGPIGPEILAYQQLRLPDALAKRGVTSPPGATLTWSADGTTLTARNTPENLDTMEQYLLRTFEFMPQQVHTQVTLFDGKRLLARTSIISASGETATCKRTRPAIVPDAQENASSGKKTQETDAADEAFCESVLNVTPTVDSDNYTICLKISWEVALEPTAAARSQAIKLDTTVLTWDRNALRLPVTLAGDVPGHDELAIEIRTLLLAPDGRSHFNLWKPSPKFPMELLFSTPPAAVQQLRQAQHEKLQTVIIPEVEFKDTPLGQAVDYIRQRSRELDPASEGINILLKVGPPKDKSADDEATPRRNPSPPRPVTPPDTPRSVISLSLKKVSLDQVCRAVAREAQLNYRRENHAVLLLAGDIKPLDMRKMYSAVKLRIFDAGEAKARLSGLISVYVAPSRNGEDFGTMEGFFSQYGVEFPPGATLGFSCKISSLIVNNTAWDLAKMKAILGTINVPPAQEEVKVTLHDGARPLMETRVLGVDGEAVSVTRSWPAPGNDPLVLVEHGLEVTPVLDEKTGLLHLTLYWEAAIRSPGQNTPRILRLDTKLLVADGVPLRVPVAAAGEIPGRGALTLEIRATVLTPDGQPLRGKK